MRTALASLLAVFALAGGFAAIATRSQAAPGPRPYVAGHYVLVLDGVEVGRLESMSIATSSSPAIPPGATPVPTKGGPVALSRKLELKFGIGVKPALFAWIADSWKGNAKPRNGSIIGFDASGKAGEQIDFSGATITETSIPAMDAASKTAGVFTLELDAQGVKSGPVAAPVKSGVSAKQKPWTTSAFRLSIDAIDTRRVSKIDAIEITLKTQPGAPAQYAFPPIKITSSVAALQSWARWQEQIAIGDGDDHTKTGTIELLSPDLKTALATIKLNGLGITSIHRGGSANDDATAKFDAELFCDRIELTVPGK